MFNNPDGLLRPGIFGRLRLPATELQQTMLVPDEAIVADQTDKVVMLVTADGTVQQQAVELGPLHGNLRIVRSGLSTDDQVIVEGLLRVRPGARVNAVFRQPDAFNNVAVN